MILQSRARALQNFCIGFYFQPAPKTDNCIFAVREFIDRVKFRTAFCAELYTIIIL